MFAFYDFETTGTNPAFDQPLQFAAILTDDNFKEVARVNMRAKLDPYVLPSAYALAVTGITPADLLDPALPSAFEFSQDLAETIQAWGPCTWVGYNSIAFDEEFLRQAFYQNLHPSPYLTVLNGNSRMDLLKVLHAAYTFDPEALKVPLNEKGNLAFSLDKLAPLNGFEGHKAHDALGDVEATIFMASLIKQRCPQVWEQALKNRDKNYVADLLSTGDVVELVERCFGNPPRRIQGVALGRSPKIQNEFGFIDLEEMSADQLASADADDLFLMIAESPKPIRVLATNKFPMVFPVDAPDTNSAIEAAKIEELRHVHQQVGQLIAKRFEHLPPYEHAEQKIYTGGFFSRDDQQKLGAFQQATWPGRVDLAKHFEDPRLRRFAAYAIHKNAPECLSDGQNSEIQKLYHERLMSNDPKAPWGTFVRAEADLAQMEFEGALSMEEVSDLRAFYQSKKDQVRSLNIAAKAEQNEI